MSSPRAILQEISPRTLPRAVARYIDVARRISIHVDAMGEVPEASLELKFVTGSTGLEGKDSELYAFMRGNDIETLMTVTPVGEGIYRYYIARMADAGVHVFLDGSEVATMPEATGAYIVHPGYVGFDA